MATVSTIPSGKETKTPSRQWEAPCAGRRQEARGRREHHQVKSMETIPLLTEDPSGPVPAVNEVILGMRMMGYLVGKAMYSDEKDNR